MEGNFLYRTRTAIQDWAQYHFVTKKLNTGFGIALLALSAVAMSYAAVLVDYKIPVIILVGLAGILTIVLCLVNPVFGFYFSYFISGFTTLPEKIINSGPLPAGLIPEYFSYVALAGVITKQQFRKEIDKRFWNNSITIMLIVLLFYYLFQIVNPNMMSKLGWFNFMRKQLSLFAFFYASYSILNSLKAIRVLTYFWLGCSTFHALYACKQQWFGLAGFENTWLLSDPLRITLFINWNYLRKFGLLSDPASAGILYAASGNFLLAVALWAKTNKQRILFYTGAIINLLASTYTGTRTATLMIVAGIAFYCVLCLFERRTYMLLIGFTIMIVGIMVAPIYDNPVINRVRSTFEPSKDNSALIRDYNRKLVQPYIYSHPIGGGIFTSGNIGESYNPGHYLNNFPPDSGYLQILMDQGYIGLLLVLLLYYVVLRTGIKYFYRSKTHEIKQYYLAYLIFLFSMMVAMFSQMAIPMYPSVFLIFSAFALLLKMHYFDAPNGATES